MNNRKPMVVTAAWEVRQALRVLGLTPEIVRNVAEAAAAGKAESLDVDPCSAPGTLAYIRGIRSIRLQLLPHGWRLSRAGNVESTVNDELGIQICFQNVDQACGERDPQAISAKGSGSRKLIQDGQAELFDRTSDSAAQTYGAVPTVWVVCVSTNERRLQAEISCPDAFEGDQFDGFIKRIFVVDESFDPTPEFKKDDDDGPADYEVRISKK
jgi:hypothetical protein